MNGSPPTTAPFAFDPSEVPPAPFPGPNIKSCPKCGEDNPSEAVMCWACYTPLSNGQPQPREPHPHEIRERRRTTAIFTLLLSGLALAVGSGWLPRRHGVKALAAGAGLAGMGLALESLRDTFIFGVRFSRTKPPAAKSDPWNLDPEAIASGAALADEEPIVRIAKTILLYALKDGAESIRLTAGLRGLGVRYRINNEWHEQMKIPAYISQPLLEHFRSGVQKLPDRDPAEVIPVHYNGQTYYLNVTHETDDLAEYLTLGIYQA